MKTLIPAALLLLLFAACDSGNDALDPIQVQVAKDVEADPTTGRDPTTGQAISNGLFTLFDLDGGAIRLSSSETDKAKRQQDSTSAGWDIGLRGTTIVFNGGISGPGTVEAQLLKEAFADVKEAPASGYLADGAGTCPGIDTPGGTMPGHPYVLCLGSGNGWYTYDAENMVILPTAGRTVVLKTSEGDYAKMRILSYYKGSPAAPTVNSEGRYYTFEFVVRKGGSRDLSSTGS